jgi:amino acid transporter
VLVAERRSVSRASIEDGTVVMTLARIVAMGTLPNVSTSATPFADASLLFMGAAGALLIGAGSVIAMTGKNMGTVLTGSRVLFALAENGELVLRSSTWATITIKRDYLTAILAPGLALSGSFAILAVASAIARLVTYISVSTAAIRLRHQTFGGAVGRLCS